MKPMNNETGKVTIEYLDGRVEEVERVIYHEIGVLLLTLNYVSKTMYIKNKQVMLKIVNRIKINNETIYRNAKGEQGGY